MHHPVPVRRWPIRRGRAALSVALTILLMNACSAVEDQPEGDRDTTSPRQPTDTAASDNGTSAPPSSGSHEDTVKHYDGPPLRLEVTPDEDGKGLHVVTSIRVRTGGWALQADSVETAAGTLRIDLTLEAPGEVEIVTMALATLRHEHRVTDGNVRQVEVWVRQVQRGAKPDTPPVHELAAKWNR